MQGTNRRPLHAHGIHPDGEFDMAYPLGARSRCRQHSMVAGFVPMLRYDHGPVPVTRPSRSTRSLAALVLACVIVLSGTALPGVTPSSAGATPPILGLLGATPSNYQSEQEAGVDAVTIQVGWDLAEPSPNVFSTTYMGEQGLYPGPLTKVDQALAAGLKVIIDPGLQYPPQWVVDLPSSPIRQSVRRDLLRDNGIG